MHRSEFAAIFFYMQIRALRSDEKELFRTAHEWTEQAPDFFRQLNRVFGWKTFEDYYEQACEASQVSFGVFEGKELVALIALIERAKGLFEAELSARRGTAINSVACAVRKVGNALIASGRVECYIWVARANRPVLRMCEQVGFHQTGISLLKGSCKGRTVEWLKLASTNAQWKEVDYQQGPENHADHATDAGEHLRLADAAGHARHLCAA